MLEKIEITYIVILGIKRIPFLDIGAVFENWNLLLRTQV